MDGKRPELLTGSCIEEVSHKPIYSQDYNGSGDHHRPVGCQPLRNAALGATALSARVRPPEIAMNTGRVRSAITWSPIRIPHRRMTEFAQRAKGTRESLTVRFRGTELMPAMGGKRTPAVDQEEVEFSAGTMRRYFAVGAAGNTPRGTLGLWVRGAPEPNSWSKLLRTNVFARC